MNLAPQPLVTRRLVRGTVALFDVAFLEQDESPIVPADPATYPAVSITDATGTVVESGVGVSLGDGRWQYQFMVPADAVLSTDSDPWRIEWSMVSINGRQAELAQNFDVIDVMTLLPQDRAYTTLVRLGDTARLVVKFRQPQTEVRVVFSDVTGSCDYSASVQSAVVDGWYAYYIDTPEWQRVGHYLVTWTTRQTVISPTTTIIQQVRVPQEGFWWVQPSLRMMIDKIQKKSGHVQSYSDSDMYEYLLQGTNIVNGKNPISSFTLDALVGNSILEPYLLAAAAWWGLQAQFLSEGELAFNFSGQTVTLDVDRTAYYEAQINRLKDFLDSSLEQTKKNILRSRSTGTVAGRPYSYRHGPFVARMAQQRGGITSNAYATLGRLGVVL